MGVSALPEADAALPPVPLVDLRGGGPAGYACQWPARVEAVRGACLGWLPAGRLMARVADPLVRRWMRRSGSAYVGDIEVIAGAVPGPGTWLLHGAYLFGCTALIDPGAQGPRLRRTLDWPFPGLGRLVEVARQRGPAGDYLNVTWPGFAGVLTAVAPGRFAAAINQAPLRRRTTADWLRWTDYAINAVGALAGSRRELPDHLLRRAFETCASFEAARDLLLTTPVARPVLFTIVGTRRHELALIEREETAARLFAGTAAVANNWHDEQRGWEGRVCGTGQPAENNRRRQSALDAWAGKDSTALDWAKPPVINPFTRLTTELCASTGALRVAGWEASGDAAMRVTRVLQIGA
jgi:hypothetical protein